MADYRPAVKADAPELTELRLQTELEDHEGQLTDASVAVIRSAYPDFLERRLGDRFYIMVAVEAGQIVSTAAMIVDEKPVGAHWPNGWRGRLMQVYTLPEHRRQGHAKKLCGMLIDLAQELGASIVDLEATPSGRYLYESLGFKLKSSYCVEMELPLAENLQPDCCNDQPDES